MKYLPQIRSSLVEIANKYGLTGVSVDLAIDLLSQAIYYNKADSLSLINKNSIDTTNSMNSMVQYALTNLYPIYRGNNAIIRLTGLFTSAQTSIPRGTKIFSSKQFNLYLKDDLIVGPTDNVVISDINNIIGSEAEEDYTFRTVDLVVAKNFIPDTKFDITDQAFYVESSESVDVSEDVQIKRKLGTAGNETLIPIEITRLAGNHLDRLQQIRITNTADMYNTESVNTVKSLALLLTSYNYGIRLYPGETIYQEIDVDGVTKGYNKLTTLQGNYEYYYNYFPYLEYNPIYDEIKKVKIDGFQFMNVDYNPGTNINNGTQTNFVSNKYGIQLVKYSSRETIDSGIPYRVQTNLVGMQKVRSVYDIRNSFNQYFVKYAINSAYKITSNNTGTNLATLYITYIPKDGSSIIDTQSSDDNPTAGTWASFKKNILYFLPIQIADLEIATPFSIRVVGTLYSEVPIDGDLINSTLDSFNNKTNCSLVVNEILSKLNKIPNVVYSKLKIFHGDDELSQDAVITEDELGLMYYQITSAITNQLIDNVTNS